MFPHFLEFLFHSQSTLLNFNEIISRDEFTCLIQCKSFTMSHQFRTPNTALLFPC